MGGGGGDRALLHKVQEETFDGTLLLFLTFLLVQCSVCNLLTALPR